VTHVRSNGRSRPTVGDAGNHHVQPERGDDSSSQLRARGRQEPDISVQQRRQHEPPTEDCREDRRRKARFAGRTEQLDVPDGEHESEESARRDAPGERAGRARRYWNEYCPQTREDTDESRNHQESRC
jgi:hypothetical protein